MSDDLHLRVVRGEPTAEELAAVIALVSRSGGDESVPMPPQRGRWSDPAWNLRRALFAGPGGWRAASR